MAFYYLYDNTTGKLISETTAQPSTGFFYRTRAARFDSATELWDEVLKDFKPKPVLVDSGRRDRDRFRAIANKRGVLTAQERDELLCYIGLRQLGDI